MNVQIRAHDVHIDDGTRNYAHEKIGRAVNKVLTAGGSRVDIELTNLDQGTGAPLSRVSVHVHIPHAKAQVVKVENADLRAAIDDAADRIGRAVKRSRERRRDKARRAPTGDFPAVQRPEAVAEED